MSGRLVLSLRLRCLLDSFANPDIGATATDVAGHPGLDIRIAGMKILRQKRRRRHDLSRLAVAALRHFADEPGLLRCGAAARLADALDGRDCFSRNGAERRDTGARRGAVDVHGAGAAQAEAAAEFGARHAEDVAKRP